jgi:peptidyl-dipeptidase Dcp
METSQAQSNPLLKPWQTPLETPPFAEIVPEHFLPAFEQAFADHAAEVAAITHDPSVPDFANTITALERSGKLLSKVSSVFYDLVSANSNPALLEIDKEVSLRMARHWNPIIMNAVLFGRIALLRDNRATLGLTSEQTRLLERTYTRFHRAGAGLDEVAKKRMADINERLAHLGTAFSHHLLGDEQDWFMELSETDLDGQRARHGRQGGRDAVAILRGAVPEELRPARSARKGLQGLHRARRQQQRQRQ